LLQHQNTYIAPVPRDSKATTSSNHHIQHHNYHYPDEIEKKDTDYINFLTPRTTPHLAELTGHLKLRIFPKDKSNTLGISLKPSKQKSETINKNKLTNQSDNESVYTATTNVRPKNLNTPYCPL